MPQHHLTAPRGRSVVPRSIFLQGRFGRMFRTVPAFEPTDADLDRLAATMVEVAAQPGQGWQPGQPQDLDNDNIPAGFTYIGQFIDHDITFDPVSSLQRQNDPDALHNFRTPRFDLDSVYGRGPNNDPFLYDQTSGGTKLLIGQLDNGEFDLPRNNQGRALIGDPRNDENIIVAQLHLLFLLFHNKVVDELGGGDGDAVFSEAQRIVRWHYQWVVVNDFLRRLVGDEVVDDILTSVPYLTTGGAPAALKTIRLRFYGWQRQPFMPVEFSVAAYRFGHSMIRPSYLFNSIVSERPLFSPDPNAGPLDDLRGFRPLPTQWSFEWDFFFETGDGTHLQSSRKIDAKLAPPLQTLPGLDPADLALRNLRRGRALSLPAGQDVARAMCLEPLTPEQLALGDLAGAFGQQTPLWFYVLREADALEGGRRLGPVGGRIVAEVLLGLLKGDDTSFINVFPCWTPELPSATAGTFTMADVINFAAPPGPPQG